MATKVSVVVATYNSPPGLDDLLRSLDEQSLPDDEYELVFVDDGSSDGTFDRLRRLASDRTNMVVDRIPNSGWPGRPRNVGTTMARGEYVFYADHDDYFFPEALERMYDFAVRHDLDVVHPKEVVKGWSRPGWVSFRHHLPHVERLDQVVLQCITPHKLYRRSFLLEHQVAFPEGRVRLEDFHLNGQAWARTDAIGVLADYPCYQWIIHEDNSHKASYDYEVYWASFRESLRAVLAMPAGPKQDQLLVRWYRSRVLERVAGLDRYEPDHLTRLLGTFAELLEHFPERLDVHLTAADRARSALLRAGDREGMQRLAVLDRGVHLDVLATRARWDEGRWLLEVDAAVVGPDGAPFPVDVADGRVVRRVPAELRDAVDGAVWDLTGDLPAAYGEVVLRARETAVDWLLPAPGAVHAVPDGGAHRLEVTLSAVVDPAAAACGGPLGEEVYDVFVRLSGLGITRTRRVPAGEGHRSAALVDGREVVCFDTNGGNLAVDLSGGVRSLASAAGVTGACLHRGPDRTCLDLPGVHVAGESELPAALSVGAEERPARLLGRDGRAWVECDGALPGSGPLRVTVRGHTGRPVLTLDGDGRDGGAGPGGRREAGAGSLVTGLTRALRRRLHR